MSDHTQTPGTSAAATHTGLRLLIVMPSWLGDVVMATPALRLIREALPGALIGALLRPGLDELLAGSDLVDQIHVDRARGVMGPKIVASRLRQHRYDTCLLLTNSFSTALIARLAFIRRRIGYDRDGRGLLLTDKLAAPRRERSRLAGGGFAPVPAVEYYLQAARVLIGEGDGPEHRVNAAPPRLELPITPDQADAGARILREAGIAADQPYAILNPGANNELKRWPAERFAQLGAALAREHGLGILINGSPAERDLAREIAAQVRALCAARLPSHSHADPSIAVLADLGITIGSLKEVTRRAALMVTNDTGPRHIAAAFRVPRLVLFGPTDPRWTTLPAEPPLAAPAVAADFAPAPPPPLIEREICLTADPTLPPDQVADDHPERCRVDRIPLESALKAAHRLAPAALAGRPVGRG